MSTVFFGQQGNKRWLLESFTRLVRGGHSRHSPQLSIDRCFPWGEGAREFSHEGSCDGSELKKPRLAKLQAVQHPLIGWPELVERTLWSDEHQVQQATLGTRQSHKPVAFAERFAVLLDRRSADEI